MNHSHCLYLTLACDEYSREWAVLLTGLFSSSKLTFSFDMSACSVSATGLCSQMWWTILPWDIPPAKTWSLCFSPVMPSAVSWREVWLLGSQPWRYSESIFSSRVMCVHLLVRHILFFSPSVGLWGTERVHVPMVREWWQLWLCCFHQFPSHFCW